VVGKNKIIFQTANCSCCSHFVSPSALDSRALRELRPKEALFQNGDVESYFSGSSELTADLIRPDRGDVEAV
jgi:hypothetical protein